SEAKVEDVRAFEKEGALLGEKERKSGEVDTTRIDVGLSEVRVCRERTEGVRPNPLRDVEARVTAVPQWCQRTVMRPASGERRSNAHSEAEIERRQASEKPGATRLRHLDVL